MNKQTFKYLQNVSKIEEYTKLLTWLTFYSADLREKKKRYLHRGAACQFLDIDYEKVEMATITKLLKDTEEVVDLLFEKYKLTPIRQSPSVDGYMFLTYQHLDKKDRELFIEIYDDGAFVALVNDAKKIIVSVEIENNEFDSIVQVFKDLKQNKEWR